MSWAKELYRVYENNCGTANEKTVLLPVSHSTANAQIEVTVDENGNFAAARTVDKSEAMTVIPVTEDSGARANGIFPMPFADKLIYIAGDYPNYADGKRSDNSEFYKAYTEQLEKWKSSEYSHPAVNAVYAYIMKGCIMKDLVGCGVLKCSDETGKLTGDKISGIAQSDAFVRFRVNYSDLERESRTWEDKSLYDSFARFNESMMGNEQLCYATGRVLPATYKHPAKLRNTGDKAKLISANDESGFTYRGRFRSKEEAFAVSYDFSQKMHNALKWLLANRGFSIDSLSVAVWSSTLQKLPSITADSQQCYMDEYPDEDFAPVTEALHAEMLKKMVYGYQSKYSPESKVMIIGVDAATTGRLSVSMYSEQGQAEFYRNLEQWHEDITWRRFDPKTCCTVFKSFSIYEIIKCAYGTEQGNVIDCNKKLQGEMLLRLIPCETEGRALPWDIVRALVNRASQPLAYEKPYNHRTVLETACGMIKKYNIDSKRKNENYGGIIAMGYDDSITDRSYLYGCLLAIADAAENSAYDGEDKGKRITNARRCWNSFSSHPCRTWETIEIRLVPYMNKLGSQAFYYKDLMDEIMNKMSFEAFNDDTALEPAYLLGYHHFSSWIYTDKKTKEAKKQNNEQNNENEEN